VLARVAGVAIAPALRPAETPEGALL
jgi:hypothetical protein